MTSLRVASSPEMAEDRSPSTDVGDQEVLSERQFLRMISRERKRSLRSNSPLLLMLLESSGSNESRRQISALNQAMMALVPAIRETDIIGWYREQLSIGVIFTDLSANDKNTVLRSILDKISATLRKKLKTDQLSQISMSFHFFPDDWNGGEGPGGGLESSDPCSDVLAPVSGKMSILGIERETDGNKEMGISPVLYPDLCYLERKYVLQLAVKRAIDIIGSCAALLFFAPLFIVTALLVKLSSSGPILYRQQRLGQFGRTFSLLKFRSMRVNNDAAIHKEFMKSVIAGKHNGDCLESGEPVYKMTNDPRITPIGRFLRRASLDELPQFINVLMGDMSLVGPRPPLAYEFDEYQLWHRRRVLEAKPGITGLWQVKGRSRVRFDDMVRLDLQYVRTWSLWLDFMILIKTPAAVLLGDDAF